MTSKKLLTVPDVIKRVQRIEGMAGDDEMAHGAEDQLHEDVLEAIANGARNPKLLALHALKTREIEFSRWYA